MRITRIGRHRRQRSFPTRVDRKYLKEVRCNPCTFDAFGFAGAMRFRLTLSNPAISSNDFACLDPLDKICMRDRHPFSNRCPERWVFLPKDH